MVLKAPCRLARHANEPWNSRDVATKVFPVRQEVSSHGPEGAVPPRSPRQRALEQMRDAISPANLTRCSRIFLRYT